MSSLYHLPVVPFLHGGQLWPHPCIIPALASLSYLSHPRIIFVTFVAIFLSLPLFVSSIISQESIVSPNRRLFPPSCVHGALRCGWHHVDPACTLQGQLRVQCMSSCSHGMFGEHAAFAFDVLYVVKVRYKVSGDYYVIT